MTSSDAPPLPTSRRRVAVPRTTQSPRVVAAVVGNAALVAAVVALAASVAYRTRLVTTNIDGLSMMSIARQYAQGDVADAVNGYWSPLVSWLMAPFIAAGVGLTTSFMVVNVATVAAVLVVTAVVVLRATRNGWLAAWVNAASGALLLANVTRQTPDLLVVLWFVLFVWALVVADRAWDGSRRAMVLAGVALGAACAFGYVSKLYAVPVFVAVLGVWLALRWCRRGAPRRRRQLLLPGVALGTLVLLAAPWVVALSVKYDGFTLGSSFGVNIASKFDSSVAAPTEGDYVVPAPPNDSAVSPAEDRTPATYDGNTLTAPRTNGSTADTGIDDTVDEPAEVAETAGIGAALQYYVGERIAAFPFYLTRIASFAGFAATIGVVFTALAVAGVVRFRDHAPTVLVAVATGVYALGYAGITSASSQGGNARYYHPLLVGTLLMTAPLLVRLWRRLGRGHAVRKTLVVLGCLTVVTASWTQNVLGTAAPFTTVGSGAGGAATFDVFGPTAVPDDELVPALAAADAIPAGSAVIGTNARETVSVAWGLGAQAFGRSEQQYDWQDPSFVELLRDGGIDQVLVFAAPDSPQPEYSSLGTLRASVEALSTCTHDSAGGEPVPCRVDVVDVAD